MAKVFVEDNELTDIANAIREKNGTEETYKPSEMGSAIRAIESGGENWLEYVYTMSALFKQTHFDCDDILMKVGRENTTSQNALFLSTAFQYASGFSKIRIEIYMTFEKSLNAAGMFQCEYKKGEAKTIDLPFLENVTFNSTTNMFYNQNNLEEILGVLDVSEGTGANLSNMFGYCNNLKTVRFKENTIKTNLGFSVSSLLSSESIQSIIDGLATVETVQTLTLHSDVVLKLTEAQISQIEAKNWNLG